MSDVSRVVERMRQEYASANSRRIAALAKANALKARAADFDAAVDHEAGVAAEIRTAMLALGIDPQEG
jgi:hypothetical protein